MVESRFLSSCYLTGIRKHFAVYDTKVQRFVAGSEASEAEVEKKARVWNDVWEKQLAQAEAVELRKQFDEYMKTV